MVKLATFCRECCFYQPDQEGTKKCFRGFIDKFEQVGTEVIYDQSEGVIIPRVCPSRRTHDLLGELSLEEYSELVNDEIYIFGSIIVIVESIADLEKTLIKFKGVKRISRFKFVIVHPVSVKASDVSSMCSRLLDYADYTCVKAFVHETDLIINEGFKRSKNGFMFIINAGKEFDTEMIDKVNYLVNEKLVKLLHVEPIDQSYHQSVSMSIIYKALKGDSGFTIAEKLREIAENQKTDTRLMTWEQVNAEYIN